MAQITLTLLGSFQVTVDGHPVTDFSTDKARALLAYLAVEHDRPHRRETLATLLWPDQPERRARQSLRQALLYLRQALRDDQTDHPFLYAERNEIQLDPGTDVCSDVADFEALVTTCLAHPHKRRDMCLPCLRRAEAMVAMYKGEFLTGLHITDSNPFEEWAGQKREWLHMQAMEGLTQLADYHERRGELVDARRLVQQQVRLEPWREEAHRQLMRLFALAGQRSAALSQYETCRRILQSEFGVEPASETIHLWTRIRKGTGTANLESRPEHKTVIPAQVTPFIGREAELTEIAELLAKPNCRLLTLTGPGGTGKTRLALETASDHLGLYTNGVIVVNLASVAGGEMLASAIGDALGLLPARDRTPDAVFRHLQDKYLLLVLDNFEHLVDAGGMLSSLLRLAPGVVILVTSRERLRLQEEWTYPVRGLSYPDSMISVSAQPLDYSALALFQQRAVQVERHFTFTEESLRHAVRICQMVEGLPLGIELAAAAAAEGSCAEVATALAGTPDSLVSGFRNATARHRSLRAAFEHSWALLSRGQRETYTALAVFAADFDAEAARAVAGASPSDLTMLVAKSLLSHQAGRYTWHNALHPYAVEYLTVDLARDVALRERHSAFFADRMARHESLLDDLAAREAIAILEHDRANLKQAWQWAMSNQRTAYLATMVEGMCKFYRLRGPMQEGLNLIQEALASLGIAVTPPVPLLAQLWHAQAQVLGLQQRYEEATESARQVIALGEQMHSSYWRGIGHLVQGQTLQQHGKYEAATQALEQGLQQMETSVTLDADAKRSTRLKADLMRELGNVEKRRGELAAAQQRYEEALRLYHALDDRRGESATLNNLGIVDWERGDYAGAREQLTQALTLYRALGNLPGEAKALNNLANLAAEQWDYGTALAQYQAALIIHETMGNVQAQSTVLYNLGALSWELGQYEEAREAYEQALIIHRRSGNRQAEGEILASLSLLEVTTGDPHWALVIAEEALRASLECDDPFNLANTYTYMGKAYVALQRWDEADACLGRALAIRQDIPHRARMLELITQLAYVSWRRGDAHRAKSEIEPVLDALQDPSVLEGAEDAYQVYWMCCEILRANADPAADVWQATAQKRLLDQAERVREPELRRSFLHNSAVRRRIAGAS